MTVRFRPTLSGLEITPGHEALWALTTRDGVLEVLTGQALTFTRASTATAVDAVGTNNTIPNNLPALPARLNSATGLYETVFVNDGACNSAVSLPLITDFTLRLRFLLTSGEAASGNLPSGYLWSRGATGARVAVSIPAASRTIKAEIYDTTNTRSVTVNVPTGIATCLDLAVRFKALLTAGVCAIDLGLGSGFSADSTPTAAALASLTANIVVGDCAWSLGSRAAVGHTFQAVYAGQRTILDTPALA